MKKNATALDLRKKGYSVGRGHWSKLKNDMLQNFMNVLTKNMHLSIPYGHYIYYLAANVGSSPTEIEEQLQKYHSQKMLQFETQWKQMYVYFYNF